MPTRATERRSAPADTEPPEASEPPASPYAFFHPRVVRVRRLSPSLVRVVLHCPELSGLVSGGGDQRFKLFLPRPGQTVPVLPETTDDQWYARWRAMDPRVRGVMRTYTVSGARPDEAELDVDFALHGDLGPASRWAQAARPGDRVSVLAPVATDNGGVDFRPPAGTDWMLLTGDETALPALASILAGLPAGTRVKALIEVAHPEDRLPLPTTADAEVTWLVRDPAAPDRTAGVLAALAATPFPAGTPYAWLAGEAACVRAQRRHLTGERGMPRGAITFSGYWRLGRTEDQLLDEAAAAAAGS
ncbi:siderophore-interacting protein [Actinacidiphila yeochonensis]|uniref:siderophore-interacting protein n=1 Tax=Actinacidiphila yeochonensis TaxID=89050 RepID=UPI00069007CC|nr:siderophore-interacting protein [Actinacidiphila yeochonensis]